jgi:cyclase
LARLDIKGPNLIKGVHLEGLRVVGKPEEFCEAYYLGGIDELILMDVVASLYGRNHLAPLLEAATEKTFVPITVGGGVRSVEDARHLLRHGADKVAVNTAAVARPALIREIAELFGSQCMVLSVEAKHQGSDRWEVFTENGREKTGREVGEWVEEALALGAGEILLTSVDREGTRRGMDLDLIRLVSGMVPIPIIASGGVGCPQDAVAAVTSAGADAVAMADLFHYRRATILEVREAMAVAGVPVRSHHAA